MNCGTQRYRHKARGYCIRCYELIRRLENVSRWDMSDISTLKGYPKNSIFYSKNTFDKLKKGYTKQINERLQFLRIKEEQLKRELIDPIDIEYQLRRLARRAGARNRNILLGIAGCIKMHFPPKQRKVLYHLLNEIGENIPWEGIDYGEIYSRD